MTFERIRNYLNRLGISCKNCHAVAPLPSLSLIVKSSISEYAADVFGCRHRVVIVKLRKVLPDLLGPIHEELAKNGKGDPIVLCFESNDRSLCEWLRSHKISYIIPGRQVYVPPRAMLESDRAYSSRPNSSERLSAKAQMVLIWYLLNRNLPSCVPYSEVMSSLRLKQFDVSKAAKELESMGVAEISHDWPRASLCIKYERRELWVRIKDKMRSPVKKTLRTSDMPGDALPAGVTALSLICDLVDTGPHIAAVGGEAERSIDRKALSKYEGDVLELWRYDPKVLAGCSKMVDPISLYLSMRNDPDPRIEIALKKVEEGLF